MIKIAFFDVDGTLIDHNTHRIPQSAVDSIVQLKEQGTMIFIATGRPFSCINNLSQLQSLDLIDGYLTMNGSHCAVGDRVVYKKSITPSQVKIIAEYCHLRLVPCVYMLGADHFVCDPNETYHKIFGEKLNIKNVREVHYEDIKDDEYFQLVPFLDETGQEELSQLLTDCEFTRWHKAFVDICADGNNKQNGIKHTIEHLGLSQSETISFGDGGNDMGMLAYTHIGVAMGNAHPKVQAVASYVTDSVDQDGIANALFKLGLIK